MGVVKRASLGALFVLGVSACAGPMGLTGAEAVRPLEPAVPTLTISVLAADDSTALPATLDVLGEEVATDETGHFVVDWREPDGPVTISAVAPGFVGNSIDLTELPDSATVTLELDPVILTGRIVSPDGRALPGAEVKLGRMKVRSDDEGAFELSRAIPGNLELSRPAWEPSTVEWDGALTDISVTMEPRMIRALRVGGDKAGNREIWESLLELADDTGVNAFVVDTKAEGGTIFHDTDVALAHEIGAVQSFYDLDRVIQDMDDHGLYKITRIVTFQDNFLAKARPEIAARNKETGEPWQNVKGIRWLDPTDKGSWKYPLDLAEEACRRGFDEIQFDYIRFPSDGPISLLEFDELDSEDYYNKDAQQFRIETIAAFLEEAHSRLNPMGCAVAADIFAITLESSSDEGIGQSPREFSKYIDVLSPMIYSYTYGPGWKGWDDPNEHAVELVSLALDAGIPKLEGFSIYRPWLQRAFIDTEDILGVQGVAEDRDMGWMLWSANTSFNANHLPPVDP